MKVGDWFSGIGGFSIAAERAGMEVAFHSEIDKPASRVLKHHWPDIPNLGDITHATAIPTDLDVWTAGFPCQDYSVAGNRGGLAGDRGALWWALADRLGEYRPEWFVGENVPGLLSSNSGQDFATIVDSLVECGYGVVWGVLDAQYFGVAQRRRRVFIVGHSGGEPRPEVLALGEGLFGHPAPKRDTRRTIAHALTRRTHKGGDPTSDTLIPHPDPAYSLTARAAQDRPESNAATLVSGGSTVRRLTPLECERLQGFPDNFTDIEGNSDSQRYRQMGNAVAVPVVEWIMKRIADL